jgi:hypothetical protein
LLRLQQRPPEPAQPARHLVSRRLVDFPFYIKGSIYASTGGTTRPDRRVRAGTMAALFTGDFLPPVI